MASYAFKPWVVDPAARRLLRDGQPIEITPRVFETLLILI